MKISKLLLVCLLLSIFFQNNFAVKYGSDSVVSLQPMVTFPSSDSDNEMLSFGWFKNGFELQDQNTSCTFSSVFPVSGPVSLHGGSLFLNSDLELENITTLTTMGKIYGQRHILTIDSSVERIINTHYPTYLDNLDLFVNSDLTINSTINVYGDCYINGRNKRIYLDPGTQFIVGHNSTLSLKNLELEGVDGYCIRCIDETGKILLDNVSIYMDDNFSFTVGKLEIWNNVDFSGSYTFFYDCLQTLTIANNSVLKIGDGASIGLGLNRNLVKDRLIYFQDSSSKIWIENAGVCIGSSGAQATRGAIVLSGRVSFDIRSTDVQNGLILGDGTPEGDIVAEFYPASYVSFLNGHVTYNESDPYKFMSKSTYSKLIRGPENVFYVMKDQVFSNVTLKVDDNSILAVAPGVNLSYEGCVISMPGVKFSITGGRHNTYTALLDGDNEVFLEDGIFPFYLLIKNGDNFINGNGNLSGLITLYNKNAYLTLNMDGYILNNIVLNGGTLNLAKNIEFAYDKAMTGSGLVNLYNNDLMFGSDDICWTSSIYWNASGGNIVLNSKVSLSSTWTVSGNCTIRGNSNILDLGTCGNIYIERGSTLKFKNILVQGISGTCLKCLDNAGKIIFDDAYIIQDSDFNFSVGKFEVEEFADFSGTYTFFYDSTNTITINRNSKIIFGDGMTFAVGTKSVLNKDRITYFKDNSSSFVFDNSNFHVGSGGIRFTRGSLCFTGFVNVDIDSTSTSNGIIVGDGTPANDSLTKFDSASLVRFKNGCLTYNLSNPDKFVSVSQYSKLIREQQNTFYAASDVQFSNVTIKADPLAPLIAAPGKLVSYDNCKVILPTVKYSIIGSRYNSYTTLLGGEDELFLEDGAFPMYLVVMNAGNYIRGSGDIAGQTNLYDSSAELNICLEGQVLNTINLNTGKLVLAKDLSIGFDSSINGPGVVDLKGYDLELSTQDFYWTSSIYWSGVGGKIDLNSKVSLTGTWTFSGNCTILGNNNVLSINPGGRIYVERGSTLIFKDVKIYGMLDSNISCVDDSAKIVFNSSCCKLTGDYYFQKGSFDIDYGFDVHSTAKTFHYQSIIPSIIKHCAVLTFNPGTTFNYCPAAASRNLIQLQTGDSVLSLKEATLHSTTTGISLTTGRLMVDGRCYVSSDATCRAEGITFGDGISSLHDLSVKILPGSRLELSGYIISKNLNP